MTETKPLVLIAGVTGMLGGQIADALIAKGARVRAIVRDMNGKADALRPLDNAGVELIEGDVTKPGTLGRAMEGVDTVVSALNNQESLILDGQANLLYAAEQAGVKRFLPSDFSGDFRALQLGDNDNLDMRIRFREILLKSSVAHTSVLNGAFYEVVLAPFLEMFDLQKGVFQYWGNGDTKMDFTHTSDAAKYTAEAALDDGLANQTLMVAAEQLTAFELHELFETATGRKLEKRPMGSIQDLQAEIARRRETAQNPWSYIGLQYIYMMASGLGKLTPVMNHRYPHIQPMRLREFFQTAVR
ncbi:MAG: NmrA family NAD(P)-binding protein [Bryobacterales bacterium]|nr:NmrA family NAD(P)-binding protein [Bryobacterales bacterium]